MVATEQMHAVLQRGKQDESTEEDSNSLLKSNSSESRSSSSRGGDAHRHAVSFEGATEPRTRSPAKRRHVTAKYSDAYKDVMGEDGLAMLLKACEILDSSPTKHGDSLTGSFSLGNGSNTQTTNALKCDNELQLAVSGTFDTYQNHLCESPNKTLKGKLNSSPLKNRTEKSYTHGPCTNPSCPNPSESPQWRKGPPEYPILCNACGTRWLRNKTLVPIVPKRGIRYNKPKTGSPSKSEKLEKSPSSESSSKKFTRQNSQKIVQIVATSTSLPFH